MRILYLGLPLGALCLDAAGFRPQVTCLGPLDLPGRRRVRRRLGPRGTLVLGLPDLGAPGVQRILSDSRPDALLSWFWPSRVPASVLELAPQGAFGTHPSLLPRWRGPDPYFWALHTGDAETGVTLHRLEETYDTGPVVASRRVPIAPGDDAWSLARKLDRPALELLVECARRLERGEALAGEPQDEALATWAPSPTDAQTAIDWRRPASEVLRLVRAAAPRPGASAVLGDTPVEILSARPWPGAVPGGLRPAEAFHTEEGPVVVAGDGGVLVGRVRTPQGAVLAGPAVGALISAGTS